MGKVGVCAGGFSARTHPNPQQLRRYPPTIERVCMQENNMTQAQWSELTSYWTPKVNDPNDPAAAKFRELVQQESDRIFGIKR